MKLTRRIRTFFEFYASSFLIIAAVIYFKAFETQSNFVSEAILSFISLPKNAITSLPQLAVLGLSYIAALLPGLFFLKAKIKRAPGLVIATASLILIATIGGLVKFHILIPIFYLGLGLLIGTATAAILRLIFAATEQEFLRVAFSQFVSEEMLNELLKNPEKLKLAGKEAQVTVMFTDIRGFTSYSETQPAATVVARLNNVLEKVTHIIFKYDGTVNKYMGDGVMAFWGAPYPDKKQAQKACRAALEIEKAVSDETEFKIGIGINFGQAIVGNIGSTRRFDYTVIGDSVNTAARLEGMTKELDSPVVISDAVVARLKEEHAGFEMRDLGIVKLKGKRDKIQLWGLNP
jgi:adenylate cyclase